MIDLSNPNAIKKIINSNNFHFKKSLGQNFLINPDVCPRMAEIATSDGVEGVLEIGPGIGVLTVELAKQAKRVVTIELDENLKPILSKTLADYDNTEVVFGDCMKLNLQKLIKEKFGDMKVAVCANLPYYITSPIIMSLLESNLPIHSITVMVQKEAAERICATVGSRDAGAVTVAVNYYSEAEIVFDVDRDSFMPPPNVDSAVISLKLRKEPPINISNPNKFFSLVKASFSQRRKTLANSVASVLGKDKKVIVEALEKSNIDANIRAEKMTMEQYETLFNNLEHYI